MNAKCCIVGCHAESCQPRKNLEADGWIGINYSSSKNRVAVAFCPSHSEVGKKWLEYIKKEEWK